MLTPEPSPLLLTDEPTAAAWARRLQDPRGLLSTRVDGALQGAARPLLGAGHLPGVRDSRPAPAEVSPVLVVPRHWWWCCRSCRCSVSSSSSSNVSSSSNSSSSSSSRSEVGCLVILRAWERATRFCFYSIALKIISTKMVNLTIKDPADIHHVVMVVQSFCWLCFFPSLYATDILRAIERSEKESFPNIYIYI